MTELILIRHGETEWNVVGRYQGQADPPLNNRGLVQAYELAQRLNDTNLNLLYTSPLSRAFQTAQILAESLHIPLHVDERFQEIHQGDWQTRLRSEIEARYPDLFQKWETDPWIVTPPGGESLREVRTRVDKAVDEILRKHEGLCIGIVSHRIPIALLKVRFQGMEPDIVRTLQLPNTYFERIILDSHPI